MRNLLSGLAARGRAGDRQTMNELQLSIVLMLLLFAVLGSGVWIAIALAV